MRKIIEASLVIILATLITVAIMAVIFPSHVRGGNQPASENAKILPAVFLSGTHERPGSADSSAEPKIAGTGANSACPYLAALAAASACPAAPERGTGLACPYLKKLQRQPPEAENTSTAAHGQQI